MNRVREYPGWDKEKSAEFDRLFTSSQYTVDIWMEYNEGQWQLVLTCEAMNYKESLLLV